MTQNTKSTNNILLSQEINMKNSKDFSLLPSQEINMKNSKDFSLLPSQEINMKNSKDFSLLPHTEQSHAKNQLLNEHEFNDTEQLSEKSFFGISLDKINNNEFPSEIKFKEFAPILEDIENTPIYHDFVILHNDNNSDDDNDSVCSDDSDYSDDSRDSVSIPNYSYHDVCNVKGFASNGAIKLKIYTNFIYWIGSIGIKVNTSVVCTIDYRESNQIDTHCCEICHDCRDCHDAGNYNSFVHTLEHPRSYFDHWCIEYNDHIDFSDTLEYIKEFIFNGEIEEITFSTIRQECRNFHNFKIISIKIINDFNTKYLHSQAIIKHIQSDDKEINDLHLDLSKEENNLILLEKEKLMIHTKHNFDSPKMMDDFLVNAAILVTQNAINKAKSIKVIDNSEEIILQYQTIIKDYKLYDYKIEQHNKRISSIIKKIDKLKNEKQWFFMKYNFDSQQMMDDFLIKYAILNTKNEINKVKPLLS